MAVINVCSPRSIPGENPPLFYALLLMACRLYDNPQIVQTYLAAFQTTKRAQYASIVRDTLDYLLRDMRHPEGGFYSAEVRHEVWQQALDNPPGLRWRPDKNTHRRQRGAVGEH